jgi:predicted transposase/invertase (TIGR01784 family)
MLSRTLEKIKKDLRKEGFSQGVQVGIQKGMQKGMQKGITAEKQKIALAMLQKGIDKRTIMEVTKLNKTQLEQISKKIKD